MHFSYLCTIDTYKNDHLNVFKIFILTVSDKTIASPIKVNLFQQHLTIFPRISFKIVINLRKQCS